MLQWATGGLLFCWVTTRRREVGIGYGWLLRSSLRRARGDRGRRGHRERRPRHRCDRPRRVRRADGGRPRPSPSWSRSCAARPASAARPPASRGRAAWPRCCRGTMRCHAPPTARRERQRRGVERSRRARVPARARPHRAPASGSIALLGAAGADGGPLRAGRGPAPGGRGLPRRDHRRDAARPLVPGAAGPGARPDPRARAMVARGSGRSRSRCCWCRRAWCRCSTARSTTATTGSSASCGSCARSRRSACSA